MLDVFGIGAIMHTIYNFLCTHLMSIPQEVLIEGARIGVGSFGEVRECKIQGVSFFLEHITYCGKL